MTYHKLLARQLRRFFGDLERLPPGMEPFLAAVSEAYQAADEDRSSIERSLELMSQELTARNEELRTELAERKRAEQALLDTHNQLVQAEKMASIGQLAAGVAHEINNPIGYVNANLGTLRGYVNGLLEVLHAFEVEEASLSEEARLRITAVMEQVDLAFLRSDVLELLAESKDGIRRVRQIVRDLTNFARADDSHWQWANLHKGLESTLNIVHSELLSVAEIIKDYGPLPEVECLPSLLNQVFLNVLINAAQAIKGPRGTITVRTGKADGEHVFIEISDTGEGISPENLTRIFDPFFTTKPVGQGTGLGLSLCYRIITQHHGQLEVRSQPGLGTTFRIVLPVRQQARPLAASP